MSDSDEFIYRQDRGNEVRKAPNIEHFFSW